MDHSSMDLQRKVHALEQRNHKMAQQLTLKQQELDSLFTEANALDADNKRLAAQLSEAQTEVTTVMRASQEGKQIVQRLLDERTSWLAEKVKLTSSLRHNHKHLQEMIDIHAPRIVARPTMTARGTMTAGGAPPPPAPSMAPPPPPATEDVAQLRRRLAAVEDSRRTLSEATEAFRQSGLLLQVDLAARKSLSR